MAKTGTLTLAGFLLARIAEDENAAQGCIDEIGSGRAGEPWEDGSGDRARDDFPSYPWGVGGRELVYMARVQPARVLAECEAKRRIIASAIDPTVMCEVSDDVLRALALPYSDHPDYQPGWRVHG